MEVKGRSNGCNKTTSLSASVHQNSEEDNMDLRRGPWTVEEDFKLINYIANHGEGRWNSLARCAGLKRTGKSCRLRWLNYLRPDVRRGNITLEEQLLILELHSRWGNRWSKIAQHLPGRTDNEIKNYWRTRVQKHAKQLKCDVNSKQFKDAMRYLWMPRLIERIQAANATATSSSTAAANSSALTTTSNNIDLISTGQMVIPPMDNGNNIGNNEFRNGGGQHDYYTPENSISTAASSDSFGTQVSPVSDLTDFYNIPVNNNPNPDYNNFQAAGGQVVNNFSQPLISPTAYYNPGLSFQPMDQSNQILDGGDASTDNLWNVEDIWFLEQQFNNNNNM